MTFLEFEASTRSDKYKDNLIEFGQMEPVINYIKTLEKDINYLRKEIHRLKENSRHNYLLEDE